ncbi:MAG: glycosyltransferase, partial [Thermogutta sp.]
PANKQVALFFGDIRPDKNLELFLRAMAPFQDRLFLFVAGKTKGERENACPDWALLIEELGLQDSVHLDLQYIPNEKVADYFELCDWVAMPYSSRFTSQSGVLNVAMAHRRPVLITATPTIHETLEDCPVGVAVMPDDLASLSEGIGQFLEHGCEQFHSRINEYLARFTWSRNAEITLQAYRKVLS